MNSTLDISIGIGILDSGGRCGVNGGQIHKPPLTVVFVLENPIAKQVHESL